MSTSVSNVNDSLKLCESKEISGESLWDCLRGQLKKSLINLICWMTNDYIAPEQVIPDWIVLGKGIGALICIKEIETEKKNHFERCLL